MVTNSPQGNQDYKSGVLLKLLLKIDRSLSHIANGSKASRKEGDLRGVGAMSRLWIFS